jgi:hypothetical protein
MTIIPGIPYDDLQYVLRGTLCISRDKGELDNLCGELVLAS